METPSEAVAEVCTIERCERPPYRRGLCQRHYRSGLRDGTVAVVKGTKGTPPRRRERPPIPPVAASYAYPDRHPGAPSGQRVAVYVCPACGGEHLVAWAPVDADPGLKMGTCRQASATNNAALPMFFVLAPPPGRVLDGPPDELRPGGRRGAGAEVEVPDVRPGPEPQPPRSVEVA